MNSIIKFSTILGIIFPLLFMTSCKDEDDDNDDLSSSQVVLNINNKIGDEDLVIGQEFIANGDTFNISLVRYYITRVRLQDNERQKIASFQEKYILVKGEETNSFELGSIPVGQQVRNVKFDVGIDAATNNQTETDFNSFPESDPRAIQSPSMHWNWNTGYIFVKVEGTVNGNNLKLHLGTDDLLREVDVMLDESPSAGEVFNINIDADIAQLLDGVETSSDVSTMTMNNMPLAVETMDNIEKVFSKAEE